MNQKLTAFYTYARTVLSRLQCKSKNEKESTFSTKNTDSILTAYLELALLNAKVSSAVDVLLYRFVAVILRLP